MWHPVLEAGSKKMPCLRFEGQKVYLDRRHVSVWHIYGITPPPPPGAWHTILICCTMCGTEQPKEQPQICDRGSNPVAINQFLIFFSVGSSCSRSLFSFADILYTILQNKRRWLGAPPPPR